MFPKNYQDMEIWLLLVNHSITVVSIQEEDMFH